MTLTGLVYLTRWVNRCRVFAVERFGVSAGLFPMGRLPRARHATFGSCTPQQYTTPAPFLVSISGPDDRSILLINPCKIRTRFIRLANTKCFYTFNQLESNATRKEKIKCCKIHWSHVSHIWLYSQRRSHFFIVYFFYYRVCVNHEGLWNRKKNPLYHFISRWESVASSR